MRLIKYTHACVRLEQDGRTLLLDPGAFSEVEAYDGVSHVLITHEHADHVDVAQLSRQLELNPDLRIYTSAPVAAQLGDAAQRVVTTVEVGDTLTVNGFGVSVVGGQHAEIYEGLPGCANVGFVVEAASSPNGHVGSVYHPGDSLFVPDITVSTLLVPTAAPWLKLAETLDFVRAVAPQRAFSIHDAQLSKLGEAGVDNWITRMGQTDYARIPIASSVEV